MDPSGLIRIARHLATGGVGSGLGRPRQVELRRAISAAYYALFHALALSTANALAGATPARRDQEAWRQTYRALEHGYARNQCLNQSMMSRFPEEIQRFGQQFTDMQDQRHAADYDPDRDFARGDVIGHIDDTEDTIATFENVSDSDRRAFAIYVLLRTRRN